jgi:hypothetical protein
MKFELKRAGALFFVLSAPELDAVSSYDLGTKNEQLIAAVNTHYIVLWRYQVNL